MRRGQPNHRLVKKNRSYTVHEIAFLLGVHRNTVREWVKRGLPTIAGRPVLMLGGEIVEFLRARRVKNRRPCGSDQMYCFRCRAPRLPAEGMVDFTPINGKVANLMAICPICETVMHRCVPAAKIGDLRGFREVRSSQAPQRLNETTDPSLNSDLG